MNEKTIIYQFEHRLLTFCFTATSFYTSLFASRAKSNILRVNLHKSRVLIKTISFSNIDTFKLFFWKWIIVFILCKWFTKNRLLSSIMSRVILFISWCPFIIVSYGRTRTLHFIDFWSRFLTQKLKPCCISDHIYVLREKSNYKVGVIQPE